MARINPRTKNIPPRNDLVDSNEESSPLLNAFTRALSSALDESSERRIRTSRPRKNKAWKFQKTKSERVKLNNSVSKAILKSSAKSDSDSSLDNWIDHQMDDSRKVFSPCIDSDEVIKAYSNFTEWRNGLIAAESDSVTESAHHTRVPRRKRKFKRMAIDSPAKNAFQSLSRNDIFTHRNRRNRNIKVQKNLKAKMKCNNITKLSCSQISSKMKGMCPNVSREGNSYGKRKREETKFENFECAYYNPKSYPPKCTVWTPGDFSVVDSSEDCQCSRHSSSESECELSTNDESREADDEQSDFFCETGASHGPYKSEDEYEEEEEEDEDRGDGTDEMCSLLEIRFDYIPAFRGLAQRRRERMYEAMKKRIEENGRNVEANQRRLLEAYQSFSYETFSQAELMRDLILKHFPPKK